MPQPNNEMVEMLEGLLLAARRGEITDIYFVCRDTEGDYFDGYDADDLQLLLSEVQQLALRARIEDGRSQEGTAIQ